MSRHIRQLNTLEQLALPPDAGSADHAVYRDGHWYYADGDVPLQSPSGSYIQVTEDLDAIILRISTGFHAVDLLVDDEADEYDTNASAAEYAQLLRDRLQAAYPGVDVTVDYDTNATGCLPQQLRTQVNGRTDHPEATAIDQLSHDVYVDGAWYVPR